MTPVTSQVAPLATTDTDAYTVTTGYVARVSVTICERSGGTPTYRVAILPSGESLSSEHYVVYDRAMAAAESVNYGPYFLNAGDSIRAYASSANTTFVVNGYEEAV